VVVLMDFVFTLLMLMANLGIMICIIAMVLPMVSLVMLVLVLQFFLHIFMPLWEVFVTLLHPIIKITVVVVLYRCSVVMLQVNVEIKLAHRVMVFMVLLFTVVVLVMLRRRRRD